MIPTDLQYIWKQFNGPQISAIATAIQNFYVEKFDSYFEYLNTLSLDTASDENLTVLGILLNYVRPQVTNITSEYMIFVLQMGTDTDIGFAEEFGTRYPNQSTPTGGVFISHVQLNEIYLYYQDSYTSSSYGFAEEYIEDARETENAGGMFVDLDTDCTTTSDSDYNVTSTVSQLGDSDYKKILQILSNYNTGSISFLDQFLYQLSQQYTVAYSPYLKWETETGNLASTSIIGDLCVYSGQTNDSTTTTELQEIVEAICEQSFQPAPVGHAVVVGNYYTES